MSNQPLSDKGLSIFVFAAYHQLMSGEPVREVVLRDNAGHAADPQGVREVESGGLARVADDRAVFSDAGIAFLEQVIQTLRGVAGKAESGRAIA
jgi:hypothetical protein